MLMNRRVSLLFSNGGGPCGSFLVACLLGAVLSPLAHGCEPPPIIGGERVTGTRWSGVVCLTYPDAKGRHIALGTGTLVARNLVLTAAHCLDDPPGRKFNPRLLRVYVGNGRDGGRFSGQFEVERAVAHPLYRLPAWGTPEGEIPREANDGYDFAYLVLKRPVPDVVQVIRPLHGEVEELTPGVPLALVGFGRREAAGDPSMTGYKNELRLPFEAYVGRTEFSLRGTRARMLDRGDFGGPALVQVRGEWRLLGVCLPGSAHGGTARFGLAMPAVHWAQWDSGVDLGVPKGKIRIDAETANNRLRFVTWLRGEGEVELALRELRKALDFLQENPEAHAELARLRMILGEGGAAIEAARRAAKLDPFEFSGLLAHALFRAARFEEMREPLAFARKIDPEAALLARLEWLGGCLRGEQAAVDRAVQSHREYVFARDEIRRGLVTGMLARYRSSQRPPYWSFSLRTWRWPSPEPVLIAEDRIGSELYRKEVRLERVESVRLELHRKTAPVGGPLHDELVLSGREGMYHASKRSPDGSVSKGTDSSVIHFEFPVTERATTLRWKRALERVAICSNLPEVLLPRETGEPGAELARALARLEARPHRREAWEGVVPLLGEGEERPARRVLEGLRRGEREARERERAWALTHLSEPRVMPDLAKHGHHRLLDCVMQARGESLEWRFAAKEGGPVRLSIPLASIGEVAPATEQWPPVSLRREPDRTVAWLVKKMDGVRLRAREGESFTFRQGDEQRALPDFLVPKTLITGSAYEGTRRLEIFAFCRALEVLKDRP